MSWINHFFEFPRIFSPVLDHSETVHSTSEYKEYFYSSKKLHIHKIVFNLLLTMGPYKFLRYLCNLKVITKELEDECWVREKFETLAKNYIPKTITFIILLKIKKFHGFSTDESGKKWLFRLQKSMAKYMYKLLTKLVYSFFNV